MRISVEQLNGEVLVLEVTPEMKMREVKQQIKGMHAWEDELSRDTTFVEVIFGDRKLGNDETVAEVGLAADSVVTAIWRQNVARCSYKGGFGPDIDPETLVIVEIPDTETEIEPETEIGEYAFGYCKRVAYVTILSSARHIERGAFAGCSALRHVTIPDSVTVIDKSAFQGCASLRSVTIPDSVRVIGNEAFADCSALRDVTIPDSVTDIGRMAFEYCHSLTSVSIPDSVTHIGTEAFAGCSALGNVTIPDSVIYIGYKAFAYCSQLTLRAPARLLCPELGAGIKTVANECGCRECDYTWFQDGWVCPKRFRRT